MCDFETYQCWEDIKSVKRDKKYHTGHTYRRSEKVLKNCENNLKGFKINVNTKVIHKNQAKFVTKLDDQEYVVDLSKLADEQSDKLISINKRKNWLLPDLLSNIKSHVSLNTGKKCKNLDSEIVIVTQNINKDNTKTDSRKNSNLEKHHKISAIIKNDTNDECIQESQENEKIKKLERNIGHKKKHKIQKKDEEKKEKQKEIQHTEAFSFEFYETRNNYSHHSFTKEKLARGSSTDKKSHNKTVRNKNEPVLFEIETDEQENTLIKKEKIVKSAEIDLIRARKLMKKLLNSAVEVTNDHTINYKPLFGIRAFENRKIVDDKFFKELNKVTGSKFSRIFSINNNVHDEKMCDVCCDVTSSLLRLEPCLHDACESCWKQYFDNSIDSFKTLGMDNGKVKKLTCIYQDCKTVVDIEPLSSIVQETYIVKYSEYYSELSIFSNNYAACKNKNCNNLIDTNNKSPVAICECDNTVCKQCGQDAHYPASCELYVKYRKIFPANKTDERSTWIEVVKGKTCPKCRRFIEKNGGCNHMSCACGTHFCWQCLTVFGTTYSHNCSMTIDLSEVRLFTIPKGRVLEFLQDNMFRSDNLLLDLQTSKLLETVSIPLDKNTKKMYDLIIDEYKLPINANDLFTRCLKQFYNNLVQMASITSSAAIQELANKKLTWKSKVVLHRTSNNIELIEKMKKTFSDITNISRFYDLIMYNMKMKRNIDSLSLLY